MKKIFVTNCDNEVKEITSQDFDTFLEMLLTADNLRKAEVFDESDSAGWMPLQEALERINGISLEEMEEEGIKDYIDNLFENIFMAELS